MTQEEFAERIGISPDFLSLVERGINAPSFEKIEMIAKTLKIPPYRLFQFDVDGKKPKGVRARKPRDAYIRHSPPSGTDAT